MRYVMRKSMGARLCRRVAARGAAAATGNAGDRISQQLL
jgi:hypothetical protein